MSYGKDEMILRGYYGVWWCLVNQVEYIFAGIHMSISIFTRYGNVTNKIRYKTMNRMMMLHANKIYKNGNQHKMKKKHRT